MSARPSSIDTLPAVLQASVERFFEGSDLAPDALDASQLDVLSRLVACSEFAAGHLSKLGNSAELPEYFVPPVAEELATYQPECEHVDELKRSMRRFRSQWMVRLLLAELGGQHDTRTTLVLLSDLADRMIEVGTEFARQSLVEKFGVLKDSDGIEIPLVVIG